MRAWTELIGLLAIVGTLTVPIGEARGDENRSQARHNGHDSTCVLSPASHATRPALEGLQLETSDIAVYERFFSQVLRAPEVERVDHPQRDSLRGYCYRDVLIVVRQDLRSPRPTGWVQINFSVLDVAEVQRQVEQALQESDLTKLTEEERAKIVRLRFKPEVMRHNCKAARLEVGGPEGFMIGFDQFTESGCSPNDRQTPREQGGHNQSHSQ
jgi:hypothetical protein